jgi:hypothetical protein
LKARADDSRRLAEMELLRRRQIDLVGGEIARKAAAGERLTREEQRELERVEPRALAEMSEEYRLSALPRLVEHHYVWAEALAYTDRDIAGATAAYARSKQYAQDLMALAPKFKDHPSYTLALHRVTIALAAHALREGDRLGAVRGLTEAVVILPPPTPGFGHEGALQGRLVNYLLDVGERESVASYLERIAPSFPDSAKRMLEDAAAIRSGRMPMSYQYMKSRQ